jgi:hypothetical protein
MARPYEEARPVTPDPDLLVIERLDALLSRVQCRPERPLGVKFMAARRCKTLVLCRDCHDDVHAGRRVRTP